MMSTNLTVCIPSYRNLDGASLSIDSGMNYAAGQPDIEVLLSDNSGDLQKREYYSALISEDFRYQTIEDPGAYNWLKAAEAARGHYIQFLADDDYLQAIGPRMKRRLSNRIAGYQPISALWHKQEGLVGVKSFSVQGNSPLERIKSYSKLCQGNNTTIYGSFKRDLWIRLLKLSEGHPLAKATYFDWAWTYALCASGEILLDPSSLYIYDVHQWYGPPGYSLRKVYEAFGRTEFGSEIGKYWHLFLAVDSFVFTSELTQDHDASERIEASFYLYAYYKSSFLQYFHGNRKLFSDAESEIILKLEQLRDGRENLECVLECFKFINQKLAERYRIFYQQGVHQTWGLF